MNAARRAVSTLGAGTSAPRLVRCMSTVHATGTDDGSWATRIGPRGPADARRASISIHAPSIAPTMLAGEWRRDPRWWSIGPSTFQTNGPDERFSRRVSRCGVLRRLAVAAHRARPVGQDR